MEICSGEQTLVECFSYLSDEKNLSWEAAKNTDPLT